ncbi:hypothetical protein LTR37_016357 [Vermiconidia calcicola]|uniref:Uncharacterized protein n=1 Tax=Vermiconidia calcicola TaxID=1690605 RepID=A0ACC3MNQ9_9PEZI|nr:hypothetical protein LTR37_016357 [Vermiconidia calcicola]
MAHTCTPRSVILVRSNDRNSTLLQAAAHPKSDIGREVRFEFIDTSAIKRLDSQSGFHSICVEPYGNTVIWNFVKRVRTDRINGGLRYEESGESIFHDDVDLGATGVGVRSVEAAWAEEAQGHRDAGSISAGINFLSAFIGVAAEAGGHGVSRRPCEEVVDKVAIFEHVDSVDGGGCKLESFDEVDIVGGVFTLATLKDLKSGIRDGAQQCGGEDSCGVHLCLIRKTAKGKQAKQY